jgi:hypothetical protein
MKTDGKFCERMPFRIWYCSRRLYVGRGAKPVEGLNRSAGGK